MEAPLFKCGHPRSPENIYRWLCKKRNALGAVVHYELEACRECRAAAYKAWKAGASSSEKSTERDRLAAKVAAMVAKGRCPVKGCGLLLPCYHGDDGERLTMSGAGRDMPDPGGW